MAFNRKTKNNITETTGLFTDNDIENSAVPTATTDGELSGPSPHLTKKSITPLPWRQVSILCFLTSTHSLTFEIIFPFVNQMILELGYVKDPENVGYYSGVIESLFAILGLITVMPWSYVSDRWGRKPVILIGIFGMGISIAIFGISDSYWFMFASRSLSGVFGGGFATIKVMIAEITDKTNQANAFAIFGVTYRLGQVFGQPLGGLLSHPERQWSLFNSSLWLKYPFALPCFTAGLVAAMAVLLGYFQLNETLPSKREKRTSRSSYGTMADPAATESLGDDVSEPPIQNDIYEPSEPYSASIREVLTPTIITILISNIAMVFLAEMIYAVYPLFGFTPVSLGGLGLSEAQIGTHLSLRAVFAVLAFIPFGTIQNYFGVIRLYQLCMILWPMTVLFLPLLNFMARQELQDGWLFNSVLLLFFVVWSFAFYNWVLAASMMVDATPFAEALATCNAVFQISIGIAQAAAPMVGTALFAFSKNTPFAGGNLIWILLFSFSCLSFLHSLTFKEFISAWREDHRSTINHD